MCGEISSGPTDFFNINTIQEFKYASSDFSTDIESGDILSLFAVSEPKSVSVDTQTYTPGKSLAIDHSCD